MMLCEVGWHVQVQASHSVIQFKRFIQVRSESTVESTVRSRVRGLDMTMLKPEWSDTKIRSRG